MGLNYRGLSFFNSHSEPHLSYSYLDCVEVTQRATQLHVALSNGEHLWFQASIAAAAEFVALFRCYRDVAVPIRKAEGSITLRTVAVTDVRSDMGLDDVGVTDLANNTAVAVARVAEVAAEVAEVAEVEAVLERTAAASSASQLAGLFD